MGVGMRTATVNDREACIELLQDLSDVTGEWLSSSAGEAFDGLSSRAVVSIMAVMVLGHGLERSGVTKLMTRPLAQAASGGSQRLLMIVMLTVGVLSAFMQNVGATALGTLR